MMYVQRSYRKRFLYLLWLLLNVTADRVAWLACSFRKGSRAKGKARSAWLGPRVDGPSRIPTRSSPWTSCHPGRVLGNFIIFSYVFISSLILFCRFPRYVHVLLLLLLLYHYYIVIFYHWIYIYYHYDCRHYDCGSFINIHRDIYCVLHYAYNIGISVSIFVYIYRISWQCAWCTCLCGLIPHLHPDDSEFHQLNASLCTFNSLIPKLILSVNFEKYSNGGKYGVKWFFSNEEFKQDMK